MTKAATRTERSESERKLEPRPAHARVALASRAHAGAMPRTDLAPPMDSRPHELRPITPVDPGVARGVEASSEELARGICASKRDSAEARAAFGQLVERHEASILRFLRTRTANEADAEELAQEVFLRAWRKLELFDPSYRFSTWLFTLARHVAIGRVRTRRERVADDDDAHEERCSAAVDDDPSRGLWERERAHGVWAIADRVLSSEQREALWLRYAEDLSAEEIGAVLSRSPAAVRVLLFRARTALAGHVASFSDHASAAVARPGVARPSAAQPSAAIQAVEARE